MCKRSVVLIFLTFSLSYIQKMDMIFLQTLMGIHVELGGKVSKISFAICRKL